MLLVEEIRERKASLEERVREKENQKINFQEEEENLRNQIEQKEKELSELVSKQGIIKKQIEDFLPRIEHISNNYKKMQYPPYYYGLLLLRMGDKDLFLKAFVPFVKKKQKDFWVWSHLAEAFEPTSEEYFMCLCKSMHCNAPDKFSIGVRQKLADAMVQRKMFAEAKYEYQKIIAIRENEGWPLKEVHKNWLRQSWWMTSVAVKTNQQLYAKNAGLSNNLLYTDIPEQIAVVTNVNTSKKVFGFSISKEINGFSVYAMFDYIPKQGDFVKIRLKPKEDSKSNFYQLYSLKRTKEFPSDEIYKPIKGKLVIHRNNSFGFIDNVYVSPQIISKHRLANNQEIMAIAIQTYNTKRKAWGWNVIDIEKG